MRIGMVGLGRMGGNMTRRLVGAGHEVVVFDHDAAVVAALAAEDPAIRPAGGLAALVDELAEPRVVWVMVPAGAPTTETVHGLVAALSPGDVVVNGGNCRWTDALAYSALAAEAGVAHVDAGVSGGVWGLAHGYCLMVGGDEAACRLAAPVFTALATEGGYARVGGPGSGHFTKMVHNGIEYALLQAYAEGFALLHDSGLDVDLADIAELWRHGSVVRSWLLDLVATVLAEGGDLSSVAAYVEDSGEGRWTVEAAVERAVAVPAIAASLFARFASRRDSFGDRLIAALRAAFGGHAVRSPADPGAERDGKGPA
ncbi:MAG TPA: decarboxylating 6-phosphogluconate dehydrogenase [Egibacteraceae bacterium]|nr:decarboxylating 6-phosphogluconate dehydrogenase [Egibacteraceae bacterium]